MPKHAHTIKELFSTITVILEKIQSLDAKIDLMLKKQESHGSIVTPETVPVVSETTIKTEEPSLPIPQEYREIVETVLNKNFDIKITSLPDSPGFQFSIFVPRQYSNAPEPHWKMYGKDERMKVITYADGALGVRGWVNKILTNLGQETQTRIALDRTQP